MWFFRSYWNWRGGHWLQLNWVVVLIHSHLRRVQVWLASGRVTSSIWHPEEWCWHLSFQIPCPHHPVKTQENKIWTTYLPIYLSPHFYRVVIMILGIKWDTRLKQRIQRKGGEFFPFLPRHCAVRTALCHCASRHAVLFPFYHSCLVWGPECQ